MPDRGHAKCLEDPAGLASSNVVRTAPGLRNPQSAARPRPTARGDGVDVLSGRGARPFWRARRRKAPPPAGLSAFAKAGAAFPLAERARQGSAPSRARRVHVGGRGRWGKPPGWGAALGPGRTVRCGRLDVREASVRASAAPGGGQGRIRRRASPAVLFSRTPVDLVGGSFPELLTPAPWRLLRRPRPLRRMGAGEAAAAETTG